MWTAWRDAVRRVGRAPAVLAAVWLVSALIAWPIAVSSRVDFSMGLDISGVPAGFHGRLLHELRAETVDRSQEFGSGVAQIATEAGAFVDYESRWMVSLTASYPFLALWVLLSGGIIDRLARDRPTGAHGVSAVSGTFLFRFLRLAVVIAFVYAMAVKTIGRWPIALALVLAGCNLVFDYAQVRAVVEDRRSMMGALRAALSFVRRNWIAALGLYGVNWILMAGVTAAYVALGPGTGFRFGPDTPVAWTILLWIAINQLYVVARLWVRLVFWASATTLFQSRLAHAGYVARPLEVWPDSPSAEALRNLR
jgi:hypothetical protein